MTCEHLIPTSFPVLCPDRTRKGFTLLELLVVLAIMAILFAVAVPTLGSAMKTYKLDSTGQQVVNQLNLARQIALSQGHAVQVRFYQLPDFNAAATSGTPAVYRGMQLFQESDPVQSGTGTVSVNTMPLIKPVYFPSPIVISSVTGASPVSPLIAGTSATPVTVLPNDSTNPLPTYLSNYNYVVFRYKPDGSTDLPNTGVNSISLICENDKAVAGGLPANFQTIVIDPLNGAVRSFRP